MNRSCSKPKSRSQVSCCMQVTGRDALVDGGRSSYISIHFPLAPLLARTRCRHLCPALQLHANYQPAFRFRNFGNLEKTVIMIPEWAVRYGSCGGLQLGGGA